MPDTWTTGGGVTFDPERANQTIVEPGFPPATLEALGAEYPDHCVWESHNLFFGGTHTVCWDGNTFTGAGDPRRGGVFARTTA